MNPRLAAMRQAVEQMADTMERLGYLKPGASYEEFEQVMDSFDVDKFVEEE